MKSLMSVFKMFLLLMFAGSAGLAMKEVNKASFTEHSSYIGETNTSPLSLQSLNDGLDLAFKEFLSSAELADTLVRRVPREKQHEMAQNLRDVFHYNMVSPSEAYQLLDSVEKTRNKKRIRHRMPVLDL